MTPDSHYVRPSGQGGPLLLMQDPQWEKMGPRWGRREEKREEGTWKVLQVPGCPR